MRNIYIFAVLVACLSGIFGMATKGLAGGIFDFEITADGVDAIFLAGRTDVLPIPAPDGDPNAFILLRHNSLLPEFPLTEMLPPSIPIAEGAVVRVSSRAIGGVSFFPGFNGPIFGPDGNRGSESILFSLGGISGYRGPEGALVGVFLNDTVPETGPAPATLNFTPSGRGTSFSSLSPALGQVFFIGDGFFVTNNQLLRSHRFRSPAGATRLVLGIPDGFGFDGEPGAYDDNNGEYKVRIRVTVPD